MTESNHFIAEVPLFEILSFIPNPESIKIDEETGKVIFSPSKVREMVPEQVYEDLRKICEKLCGVIKDKDGKFEPIPKGQKTPINKHEAAIFSVYFGLPKDEKEREKWVKMSIADKTVFVKNKLGENKATSFTIIM